MIDRIADALHERNWSVEDKEEEVTVARHDEESGEDADVEEIIESLSEDFAFTATPPPGDRWWANSDASLEVTVFPIDVREDPSPPTPILGCSLEFDLAAAPPLEPAWLERLQAAGWEATEDEDTGNVESITVAVPLRDLISGGQTTTAHATNAADWLEARLASLVDTPAK